MRNLKEEKFKKLYEISEQIGDLEKGGLKRREIQNETLKKLIDRYASYDLKELSYYLNRKVKWYVGLQKKWEDLQNI